MPYLEHIGLAVRKASDVEEMLESLLGLRPYKRETVVEEHVRTTFVSAGSTKLELLEAAEPESAVDRYLDRHGEGLHHLAFAVDDIFDALRAVRGQGLEPLQEAPRPGADGKQIFFLHPRQTHGILIEFCQDMRPPLESTPMAFREGMLATYRGGHPAHPSIVLIHGALGGTELEMYRLFRELETDFHVLALDLPGHASSDDISELPLTISSLEEAVIALMDDADIQRAAILGFSFGGNVALRLAGRQPSRVDRLITHAANPFWRSEDTPELFDPERIAREQPAWAQRLDLVHGAQQWKRLCRRLVQATRDEDGPVLSPDEITAVDVPVLVTGGDRDRLTPLSDLQRLCDLLPDSQLAVLPDTAHPIQHVDAPLYGRIIRQFTTPR